MPTKSEKYSQAQREAVIRAVIEQGMTAPQAISAAAKGDLGLPPFEFSLTTARKYVQRRREAQEAQARASDKPTAQDVYDLAVAMAHRTLVRVDKRHKTSRFEAKQGRELVAFARDCMAILPSSAKPRAAQDNGTRSEDQAAERTSRDRVLERLNSSEPEATTVQDGPSSSQTPEEPATTTENTHQPTNDGSDRAQVLAGAQASTVDLGLAGRQLEPVNQAV